jgi:hypothetical protein
MQAPDLGGTDPPPTTRTREKWLDLMSLAPASTSKHVTHQCLAPHAERFCLQLQAACTLPHRGSANIAAFMSSHLQEKKTVTRQSMQTGLVDLYESSSLLVDLKHVVALE